MRAYVEIICYYCRTVYPTDEERYKDIYGPAMAKRGRKLPPYQKARFNASLVLGNSHVSLGQAITLPQSYKPVAGYHIDPRVKPLPKVINLTIRTILIVSKFLFSCLKRINVLMNSSLCHPAETDIGYF